MLTSFFKKSKPLNFLIPLLILSIFFISFNTLVYFEDFNAVFTLKKIGALLTLLALACILNFVLIKDKTKGRHTYTLFLFSLFSISHWAILIDNYSIIAGFFIVFAIHRVIGMKTGISISKKIFDSFFAIALASLIFPPSLFFIIIPFIGILLFHPENYKNWFLFIPAILTVFILKTCFDLFSINQFFNPLDLFSFEIISYENFLNPYTLSSIGLIFLFIIWFIGNIFISIRRNTQIQKTADSLLIFILLSSLFVVLFSENYTQHIETTLLFPYISCALIGGRYFEISNPKTVKLKEILFITLSSGCVILAILSLWQLI